MYMQYILERLSLRTREKREVMISENTEEKVQKTLE